MAETRKTICNRDCPDACSIVATVEGDRVVRLQGDPDHPVTRGALCYRTSHLLESTYYKDRLTTPLLRTNGAFHPIGWDEALDLAADKLTRIRDESGPEAIFHYRSGGSLGILKHVCDHFFAEFGPVTVKRGDICSGAGDTAQAIDFGECESNDLFDLLNAKHILIWGKNVFTSSPHTIPVLQQAIKRGAKAVLIDPVHHRTANLCERYIQPRPGGDFDAAMAVARILFEEGWTDLRAPEYCDNLDRFRGLAFSRSTEEWCRRADIAPAEAHDLARRLGPGKPAAILVGWGMGRRINGAGIVRALDALGSISGNIGIPGGGVSFYFKRRGAFDLTFPGDMPPPRTVCEPLFGPEVLKMSDPPIRAVWVTAGNPVVMLPESRTTVEALRTREFLVVVDSVMTDTAALAHLVLPTTNLLEADDLLGAYGHHWIGVARPVVPRHEGVRSDLEILQELSRRVGLGDVMEGSAREWKERLLRPEIVSAGVTIDTLEAGPVKNPLVSKILFEDRVFPTPSGRVNLITEAPPDGEEDPDYPLFLMSLSTHRAQSSQWTPTLEGPAVATVHPEASGGVADGEICRLESAIGSMQVRIRHDPRQRKDVVLVPKGGHLRDGRCANALLTARTSDLGEGGALYDERVRIVPCSLPS